MNIKTFEALKEAKDTLNSLLGEFRTGKIVGERLRKELKHIQKQITIISENQ